MTAPPVPVAKQWLGISMNELVGLFKDKTSIEIEAIGGSYVGRWIRYNGQIQDVANDPRGIRLTFSLSAMAPAEIEAVVTDPEQMDRLRTRSDSQILFAARIETIERGAGRFQPRIVLTDVELD